MSGYDPTWTESVEEASEAAREANDADRREWEAELEQDRLHRDDPVKKQAC